MERFLLTSGVLEQLTSVKHKLHNQCKLVTQSWTKAKNIFSLAQTNCGYFLAFSSMSLIAQNKTTIFNLTDRRGYIQPVCAHRGMCMHVSSHLDFQGCL